MEKFMKHADDNIKSKPALVSLLTWLYNYCRKVDEGTLFLRSTMRLWLAEENAV
jgi:hypothetical protein